MIKTINYILTISISMLLFGLTIHSQKVMGNTAAYYCPMKCEGKKTYEKPGWCPVCKMNLLKVESKNDSKPGKGNVKITGAMMNVMHKGELSGTIDLDTISGKQNLFGIGPLEYLQGEILISGGKCFISKVAADGSMIVEETYKAKAPFFVCQNVNKWNEIVLPDSILTIPQLESYLDGATKNHSRPFAFKISAEVENAEIHIVNLPKGTAVHSPEDAHQNQKSFGLQNKTAELIGFFSTEHQGIFTHHDSYVHIHLITADRKSMGHLEKMTMKIPGAKLYLPAE